MVAPGHQLYTPEQAARSSLGAVRYQSTLARRLAKPLTGVQQAGRGMTVNFKSPIFIDPARVYTRDMRRSETPIEYSDLYQDNLSIELTDQVYNAVKLPDDFYTFTLENLEQQVIRPMAQSVADHIDSVVVGALTGVQAGLSAADKAPKGSIVADDGTVFPKTVNKNDTLEEVAAKARKEFRDSGKKFAAFGAGVNGITDASLKADSRRTALRAVRAASQLLGMRGVANGDRVLVVGSAWEAAFLDAEQLRFVDRAGADGALRQATIGNLYGFEVIVDYSIDSTAAYALDAEGVALVTQTTTIPRGAAFASTITEGGFTLRYLQDYDPDILTDRAVVDTFAGAKILDSQRVLKLTGTETMSELSGDEAPASTGTGSGSGSNGS
nr:MAG TPA: major capsid protein [Caudoviricetes sp.]